jgi:hypothetical protein
MAQIPSETVCKAIVQNNFMFAWECMEFMHIHKFMCFSPSEDGKKHTFDNVPFSQRTYEEALVYILFKSISVREICISQ